MTITLAVTPRGKETTINNLRTNGSVPAVVYGPKQEPISISLEAKVFSKILEQAGESTIVELTGLKKPIEVLIKEVAFNPIKHEITHVDFYAVEAGKEMTTHVALEYIGEAPVELSRIGTVNKLLHELEITCKPSDLPNHIDVDLTSLVTAEDKILIKDLKIPKGVTVEAGLEDPVAVVSVTKEEIEEPIAGIDMSTIEVERKGKVDSEEEKEG